MTIQKEKQAWRLIGRKKVKKGRAMTRALQ